MVGDLLEQGKHTQDRMKMESDMRKLYILIFVIAVMIFTGCSAPLSVRGEFASGGIAFTGTATDYTSDKGSLSVTSASGTTCTGNFVYVTSRQAEGTLECSDGRAGPFSFASTGTSGTGTGRLGGETITLILGDEE